jgi:hypothetical protein
MEARPGALAGLEPTVTDVQRGGTGPGAHVSLLRPFPGSEGVYVAMQLPESVATASYRTLRNYTYAITGLSLLLASQNEPLIAILPPA